MSQENLTTALTSVVDKALESLYNSLDIADMTAASDQSRPSAAWAEFNDAHQQQVRQLLMTSDYAAEALAKEPLLLPRMQTEGRLEARLTLKDYQHWCQEYLQESSGQPVEDEAGLHRGLRRFRRAVMLRLLWGDAQQAGKPATGWQTAKEISWLAEVTVDAALTWLEEHYAPAWGRPYPRSTLLAEVESEAVKPLRLVVLGMGKLGALELNLSSDIDLIFAFSEAGETLGGRRCFENQEYFTRLGQKLITALDQMTADGYVFRVDMRLRPYGDAGALALAFSALLEYYQDQGREWERYAMIKARVIAGDQAAGEALLHELRPFVYRKYLDFSAIESLRAMKAMINREVRRKGLENNIKLGRGGIREVEFITQVFQLIRGGRDTELQERSIRKVLPIIASLGLMPQQAADELVQDYAFLRDLEHALQGLADRQTQLLPEDELAQLRIAIRCGFKSWPALLEQLTQVRTQVRSHFDAVIADPDEEEAAEADDNLTSLWTDDMDAGQAEKLLAASGFQDPQASWRLVAALKQNKQLGSMQKVGRERLDNLLPLLLAAVAEADDPDVTLERVLWLIESVLRRTAYLVLLSENPGALRQLVKICSASPWLAEQLSRMPILLDELLSSDTLYSPADKARLQDELRQHLSRIPEEDHEALMEALRYFRHANVLRVAASDIVAERHLMKVSDYLTFIAEVIMESVMHFAWRDLLQRHGHPQTLANQAASSGFIVVAYGKLGGIELGYGSDLDLVFIHGGHPNAATDGRKPIDAVTFYSRLGQRIIHFLSALTPSGQLYEVDMRLRPSGNAGLLVASLNTFAEYQQKEAWTWEHQALVRARAICGDPKLVEAFNHLRGVILSQKRDLVSLRADVVAMREKMRANLGSKKTGGDEVFHIKQDTGGIVDIEFIVQYCVLAFSHKHPELLQVTDNMRLLDALAKTGVLPEAQAEQLQRAYLAYRKAAHHAALEKAGTSLDATPWDTHRQEVSQVWQRIFAV